jgi:hypothetical protein
MPRLKSHIGVHNKCALKRRNAEPSWDKADFIFVWLKHPRRRKPWHEVLPASALPQYNFD